MTATLLTEVCKDVCIEPDLQPVFEELNGATANSQPGARLDIAANGVWGGNHEITYFDVRVFNPYAPSNKHSDMQMVYSTNKPRNGHMRRELEKWNTPHSHQLHSTTGGIAKEASISIKKLASMLANKWEHSYSSTLQWLRCRLSFSLLRSSIQAIQGARSSIGHAVRIPAAVDLVTSEAHLN